MLSQWQLSITQEMHVVTFRQHSTVTHYSDTYAFYSLDYNVKFSYYITVTRSSKDALLLTILVALTSSGRRC